VKLREAAERGKGQEAEQEEEGWRREELGA
jgi:hypothetical protein